MNKIYAGIGSRKTPQVVCEVMARLAGRLGQAGWTLRSGRAEGAQRVRIAHLRLVPVLSVGNVRSSYRRTCAL